MEKFEFLTQLRAKLRALPEEDAKSSVDYYAEMIDDRMEDGLSEEEAVAAIGSVDEIAKSILVTTPLAQPAKPSKKAGHRLRWWEVTLLVLGSPVWLSLLIAAAATVFSVWVSLWSIVISLYATAIALGASTLGCIAGCFFMLGKPGELLVAAGAALVCAGLAILFFMLSNLAAKGMEKLTKVIFKGIRRIFCGKERVV